MIAARPMGVLRSFLFTGAFFFARIPLWFVLAAAFINGFITVGAAFLIIVGIILCRGYIESEMAGSGFLFFTVLRAARFFKILFAVILISAAWIYFIGAGPLDKALMAAALIIAVLLFYNNGKKRGYWSGYRLPAGASLTTTLLWLYLCFIPDSLFGNIAIIAAIYIIEAYHLFFGDPLPKIPVKSSQR